MAGTRLAYAYTHLAGAELVAPYVVPAEIYVYVKEDEIPQWNETLERKEIYPAQNGSVHLVISDINPFYAAQEVRGAWVVSNSLLYADLYGCGGRARDAARFLALLGTWG